MSVDSQALQQPAEKKKKESRRESAVSRILKYSGARLVSLFVTVVIGVYLTIMIANMGGYVDEIMKSNIRDNIYMQMNDDPTYKELSEEEKENYVNTKIALEESRLGLDQPFIVRSFRYLWNALRLDLGRAQFMSSATGSRTVRLIILDRLAPTLLLMGTSNLLLFFTSIAIALGLSRNYNSFFDRMFIALSPTSSVPSWVYGIFGILIFAAIFRILPFGGMIDAPPPDTTIGYALSVLKHMILPVGSLFISSFFSGVYNWRTFFLIFSSEDYVEMAKAKGLTDRMVQRRYILRPTMPTIITTFSLMIIGMWTGAIITETVFTWPGLGQVFFQAIGFNDVPVIVGNTIIYAYLLAMTVFLLDFFYALVDPRVKLGGSQQRS